MGKEGRVTQAEQFVRDRVAKTGRPYLVIPPRCVPSLLALPLWVIFMDYDRDAYVVVSVRAGQPDEGNWVRATLEGLQTVREWVPEPPEGVEYVYQEGALGVVQQVEATSLGVSLLQLALNRAESGLAIRVGS